MGSEMCIRDSSGSRCEAVARATTPDCSGAACVRISSLAATCWLLQAKSAIGNPHPCRARTQHGSRPRGSGLIRALRRAMWHDRRGPARRRSCLHVKRRKPRRLARLTWVVNPRRSVACQTRPALNIRFWQAAMALTGRHTLMLRRRAADWLSIRSSKRSPPTERPGRRRTHTPKSAIYRPTRVKTRWGGS